MLDALDQAIADNDRFLEESLIPDLRAKVEAGFDDPDVDWGETLDTFDARVGTYAGAWLVLHHDVFGLLATGRVTAYLDPLAGHCSDCPLYHSVAGEVYESMQDYLAQTGGRVPGEFECMHNCRCWLEEA